MDKESSLCHYNEINVLSMHALIGAYKPEGYEWVDELNQVLANNVDFACEHIWEQYKGIQVTKPQGTYMLFDSLPIASIKTARSVCSGLRIPSHSLPQVLLPAD